MKKIRAERKAAGICTHCGKDYATRYSSLCKACQEEARQRNRRAYEQNRQKQYRERKANGICVSCGEVSAEPGFVQCPACREKSRLSRLRGKQTKKKKSSNPDDMTGLGRPCTYCKKNEAIYLDKSAGRFICRDCYIQRCRAINSSRQLVGMKPKYRWLKEIDTVNESE